MTKQNKNTNSFERDGDKENNLPGWENQDESLSNSSSGEGSFSAHSPANNKRFDVHASEGKGRSAESWGTLGGGDEGFESTSPFSKPANEWQPVGDSDANVQHWWDSGTEQQQQFYAGGTGYPYRENDWERNTERQAGMQNLYPKEPASSEQNFAEGSQYPYQGGYGAENPLAREGLERAKELKGPGNGGNQAPQGAAGAGQRESDYRGDAGRERAYLPQYSSKQPASNAGMPPNPQTFNQTGRNDRKDRQYQAAGNGNREGRAAWQRNQFRNQYLNQNKHTMRQDDRNFRDNYNGYRNEEYGRAGRRPENRDYGSERDRSSQQYNRDYDRVRFSQGQDLSRDSEDSYRNFEGRSRYSGDNYDQRINRDNDGGRRAGRYHSTRTENPGRGFEREQEMNRHEGGYGRDRFDDNRRRGASEGNRNRASSSHRSTGSYEDFERDVNRFGIRQDFREGRNYSGREAYGRGQGRSEDRNAGYRPGYETDRGRRAGSMPDRGFDRGPSGDWGRSASRREHDYDYKDRYRDESARY